MSCILPTPITGTASWTSPSALLEYLSLLNSHITNTTEVLIYTQLRCEIAVVRDWLELLPLLELMLQPELEPQRAKTQTALQNILICLEKRSEFQKQLHDADELWVDEATKKVSTVAEDELVCTAGEFQREIEAEELREICETLRKKSEMLGAMLRKRLGMRLWGEVGERERLLMDIAGYYQLIEDRDITNKMENLKF